MAVISVIELQNKAITSMLPAEYAGYAIMLWPVLMLALCEITTSALSEK